MGQAALGVGHRPPQDDLDLLRRERVQAVDAAAREQRRDDLEGRVLGGGADEGDHAVLDVGQDRVLLRLVEAMDLVDEEDGALAVHPAPLLRLVHDLAQVGHAGGDGGDGREVGAGEAGDDAGQGGLAAARRPPEDHRGHLVGLDALAQHAALAHQVLLAHELVQRARAHAGGQRRLALGAGAGLVGEQAGRRAAAFPGGHLAPHYRSIALRTPVLVGGLTCLDTRSTPPPTAPLGCSSSAW